MRSTLTLRSTPSTIVYQFPGVFVLIWLCVIAVPIEILMMQESSVVVVDAFISAIPSCQQASNLYSRPINRITAVEPSSIAAEATATARRIECTTTITDGRSTGSDLNCIKTNNSRVRLMMTPLNQEEEKDESSIAQPTTTTTTTTAISQKQIPPPSTTPNWNELTPTEFIVATEQLDPTTRAVVNAAKKKQQELLASSTGGDGTETTYPIDLPSPLLLATSMILAIVSTGSLFQLFDFTNANVVVSESTSSSLEPTGFLPLSAAAVLFGFPTSIYLLYAAITKATAETEADDQAFLSGK